MDTEARLFKIAVFVITLVIAGIMLTNVIYYSGMTNNNYPDKNEATAMLWISAIVFTLAALLWIWSIYRMFHKETREEYKKKATKKFTDWAYDPNSGFTKEDIDKFKNKIGYTDTAQTPAVPPPPQPIMSQAPPPSAAASRAPAPPPPSAAASRAPAPPPPSQQTMSQSQPTGVLTQGGPPKSTLVANE